MTALSDTIAPSTVDGALPKRLAALTVRLLGTTAFRLTAVAVAAFVIMAAIVIGALFWQTNTLLTRQVIEVITQDVRAFEALARSGDMPALARVVAERSSNSQSSSAPLLILVDGRQQKLAGNLAQWPTALGTGSSGGTFMYSDTSITSVTSFAHSAVGIVLELGNSGRLLVARSIDEQRVLIKSMRWLFIGGFGLLSVTALAGGLLASRLMLTRISSITDTGATIMSGDLSRRIPLNGSDDEFDHLAGSLNAMLERIEQLMTGMREVSDNIAHDLKTPLNRLRNRAEAALRDTSGGEVPVRGLERVIEDADDLIKTFDALLLIARLEASATAASLEPFDLAQLVRDIAELYEPVAEEAGQRIIMMVPSTAGVVANRQLIGQVIANLIDNALKYGVPSVAGAEKEISLAVVVGLDGVQLSVSDRGAGIPATDRARVMKRFVRLDQSRSRPGTGLGLSLVAAVARLHAGRVILEDNQPGLRVVLELPVAIRPQVRRQTR